MNHESTASVLKVNPLADIDFDVTDPNGWYRYVADQNSVNCADKK